MTKATMITLARESRGLSQSQLATQLGMAQGSLSKIEGGLIECPPEVVVRIGEKLRYPPAFFDAPGERHGAGTAVLHFSYRRRQALGARELRRIEAQLNLVRMNVATLLRSVEADGPRMRLPSLLPEEVRGGAVQIARMVRATWLVPSGPLRNVTELIEATGSIVVPFHFGTALVDATSISLPDMPALIFTNRDLRGDRLRFTLAHELGHLVMHPMPTPAMEDEANRFASELLMPASDIGPALNGMDLQKAAALKRLWHVSMAAIIRRAHTLEKLSDDQYKRLLIRMSSLGYRDREPQELDVEIERPRLHKALIDSHLGTLGYSLRELCQLLAIFEDDFEALHGAIAGSGLRVVKNA